MRMKCADFTSMPTRRRDSSIGTLAVCFFISALALLALAYPPLPVLTLLADSEHYRQIADAIVSGQFFDLTTEPSNSTHVATSLRPPLFPILLAIASRIPRVDQASALVALHLMIGAILLLVSPLILRRTIQPSLTVLATGIALYSTKQVAWGIMSEWLAMSCLFLSCVVYIAWVARPCSRWALAVSLSLSFSILTRSALLPWLALLPFMVLQAPRDRRGTTTAALAAGLLPIFLWCAINFYRAGFFSIVPYEGLNLVATARSLGPLPLESTDSDQKRKVMSLINERGVTAADTAFISGAVHQWDGEFYEAYHSNFDVAVEALSTPETTERFRSFEVAARAIRAYPDRYRLFARGGARTLCVNYMPLILSCMATTLWLVHRRPRYTRWGLGVMTVCVVSIGYLSAIFGTMLWLHRYMLPIQPILLFCLAVSTARLIATLPRRTGTELP